MSLPDRAETNRTPTAKQFFMRAFIMSDDGGISSDAIPKTPLFLSMFSEKLAEK
jgi:hypothetical protein